MKRVLYFCAVVCLVGTVVCTFQLVSMPNLIDEAIEAADNHDPSARGDVDAAREQMPEAEELLRNAGLFLLGFGASVAVARRVR